MRKQISMFSILQTYSVFSVCFSHYVPYWLATGILCASFEANRALLTLRHQISVTFWNYSTIAPPSYRNWSDVWWWENCQVVNFPLFPQALRNNWLSFFCFLDWIKDCQVFSRLACLAVCCFWWRARLLCILPANFFILPVCLPIICPLPYFLLNSKEEITQVNMWFLTNSVLKRFTVPNCDDLGSLKADHH